MSVCNVQRLVGDVQPFVLQLSSGLFASFAVASGKHDVHSRSGELAARLEADTTVAPGDQGRASHYCSRR
jgi:hypothetical protein